MSIRKIARTFHHSRHKIRKILHGDESEPGSYSPRARQTAPKLGPFHDRILEILKQDEDAPPKQRHTAMRIFERLRDEENYLGGYDAVRRFVKKHRESKQETFIPLDHAAGQRIEAILEGMSQAFEFFGCVPKEVWWDNPKTVSTAILKGRD
jgi:transposase